MTTMLDLLQAGLRLDTLAQYAALARAAATAPAAAGEWLQWEGLAERALGELDGALDGVEPPVPDAAAHSLRDIADILYLSALRYVSRQQWEQAAARALNAAIALLYAGKEREAARIAREASGWAHGNAVLALLEYGIAHGLPDAPAADGALQRLADQGALEQRRLARRYLQARGWLARLLAYRERHIVPAVTRLGGVPDEIVGQFPPDIAWFRVERPGAALDRFYVAVQPGTTALAGRVTLWQTFVEVGGQRIYGLTVTHDHAAAIAQILALLRQHGFVNEQDELV